MENKKDGILHIRINKKLLEELKKQADKENRNLTNLIETIIKNYLNERINNMKLDILKMREKYGKKYTPRLVDIVTEDLNYYKSAKEWAKNQINDHYELYEEGSIEKINEEFIQELKKVATIDDVFYIYSKYIY